MKILHFNKKLWFIISLVLIVCACMLMFLNKLSYNNYLKTKEEFVEVDCIVVEVDDIKRTIKVAYTYDNIEYYQEFQTIEYKLQDSFVGVIRPEKPTELRFDNGYSMWNMYSYVAILLTAIAIVLNIIILKRSFVRFICMKKDKTTLKVIEIKGCRSIHFLIVEYEGKKYKSELFKTFEDISLLEENVFVDFYKQGFLHYIDLSSYKKIR